MRPVTILFAAAMTLVPLSVPAEEAKDIRKVVVSGKAENTLEAHRATIQLTVRAVKKEMSQSFAALTDVLSRVENELRSVGLDAKDIKRSMVLQGPDYSWEKQSRVLKGYYAACSVEVTVKDIRKMANVYRTLANYKAISVDGTTYERDDAFEVRKAEYEKALLAARKKAEFMAQALGAKVGRVHAIVEESGDGWAGLEGFSGNVVQKGDMSGSVYGLIRIVAKVTVEFELE